MSPSLIGLIMNGLLVLFILVGFLWGLKRGLKKSGLRLAFFIVSLVLAAVLTPVLSNVLLDIQINIDGTNQSIHQLIYDAIASTPEVGDLLESNAALVELINSLPLLFLNLVVFLLLVYVLKFISWIAFAITARIVFKKKKKKKDDPKYDDKTYTVKDGKPVVLTVKKEKKHRLLGGLVSAVQAVVLLFVTLIPISGVIMTVNNYAQGNTVSAATTENETELSKLLKDALGEEVLGYLDAYSNSFVIQAFNVANFNMVCFDSLSSISVDGEKIVLRKEIDTFVQVYEVYSYVDNFTKDLDQDLTSWEDIDFAKLENALTRVLNSGFISSVGSGLIVSGLDLAIDTLKEGDPESVFIGLLEDIKTSMTTQDEKAYDVLKSDILALIGVAKIACQSGLVDVLTQQEISTDAVIDILGAVPTGATDSNLAQMLDSLFTSTTIKTALTSATNIGLGELEKELKVIIETANDRPLSANEIVTLDRISNTSVNWTNLRNDLCELFADALVMAEFTMEAFGSSTPEQQFEVRDFILETDYRAILESVGGLYDTLFNFELLTGTINGNSIINQLYDAFAKIDRVDSMLDVDRMKNLSWSGMCDNLADIIEVLEPRIADDTELFMNLDYAAMLSAISALLDNPIFSSIKSTVYDVIEMESDELTTAIVNYIKEFDYVVDVKPHLISMLESVKIFVESGMIDYLIDAAKPEEEQGAFTLQMLLDNIMQVKQGNENSQLALAVEKLLSSDLMKVGLLQAINDMLEEKATAAEDPYDFGRIDKDVTWDGWETSIANIKIILDKIATIYKNHDFEDFEEISEDEILNENFGVNVRLGGQIFDILAASELLTYADGNAEKSIFDNLMLYLEDRLVNAGGSEGEGGMQLDFSTALTLDDTNPTFWKDEFGLVGDTVKLLLQHKVDFDDDGNIDSNLMNELFGNINFVLDEATDIELDALLDTLLNSTLLKAFTTEIMITLNETLVGFVEEGWTDTTTNKNTNFAAQSAEIKAVIKALIPVKDVTSLEDLTSEQYSGAFNTLLAKLKANSDAGEFFKTAYDKISEALGDAVNEVNKAMIKVLDADYDANIVNPSEVDAVEVFMPLVNVVNAAKEIEDISGLDAILNEKYNEFKTFLTVLQENGDYLELFEYANTFYNAEIVDLINQVNKDIINTVDEAYTSDILTTPCNIIDEFEAIFDVDVLNTAEDIVDVAFEDLLKTNKQNLIAFLNALEENYNNSYYFSTAYEKIAYYLVDFEILDDVNPDPVVYAVTSAAVAADQGSLQIGAYDWEAIIGAVNLEE